MTETGQAIALEMIRHHHLLETYLAQALKIPWDRVLEEADRLEHVLSDYLEEHIDKLLGHPTTDPHGSPIPSLDGQIRNPVRLRLVELSVRDRAEIIEVSDLNPDLVAYLDNLQLYPRVQLTLTAIEPIDGLITIQVSGQTHILGPTSAIQVPHASSIFRMILAFTGPGLLVAVGNMDPGNWATDLAGGAQFGYTLLLVVMLSNLIAIVLQALSLKLGVVTSLDLAQACKFYFNKPVGFSLWILAEIAIGATDLAEVVGSAVAIQPLFSLPLMVGVLITAFDVVLVLFLSSKGFRINECGQHLYCRAPILLRHTHLTRKERFAPR